MSIFECIINFCLRYIVTFFEKRNCWLSPSRLRSAHVLAGHLRAQPGHQAIDLLLQAVIQILQKVSWQKKNDSFLWRYPLGYRSVYWREKNCFSSCLFFFLLVFSQTSWRSGSVESGSPGGDEERQVSRNRNIFPSLLKSLFAWCPPTFFSPSTWWEIK